MSEFIFLYRSTPESRRAMESPDKAQDMMKRWRAWFDRLAKEGHLKSVGQPLEAAGKIVNATSKTVTDGPFAETKDLIGGYSIIEAADLDEAAQLAKGCPGLDNFASVEVRPVRKMDL
jgi:hypothetical protein